MWNEELFVAETEQLLERLCTSLIRRQPTDESNSRFDFLPFGDGRLEIPRNGIAQPFEDLRRGVTFLLRVRHVGLGEDRAATGNSRCHFHLHDKIADLLNPITKPGRLLINERPGSRCAISAGYVNKPMSGFSNQ